MARSNANLESWLIWMRDELGRRGWPAVVSYEDRVAGDVLVLAVASDEPARFAVFTSTRRVRGRALLTVAATGCDQVTTLATILDELYPTVPRMNNLKRKFVHRFARMTKELAATWAPRVAAPAPAFTRALAALQQERAEARAMHGVGFHTDLSGAVDRVTDEKYPRVYAAAFETAGRWHALPWDPARDEWVRTPATAAVWGAAAVAAAAGTVVAEPTLADARPSLLVADDGTSSRKTRLCDGNLPCDGSDLCDLLTIPDCDVIDCNAPGCDW